MKKTNFCADWLYNGRTVTLPHDAMLEQGRKPKDRLAITGNNHGSLVEIGGKWYIFYHRHTNKTCYSRQGCAEKITRNPYGSFAQAEMTSCGLNPAPLLPQGSYPAAIACNLTNGKMPHIEQDGVKDDIPYITCKNGEQILADVTNGTRIGYKYFAFSGPVKLTLWLRGSAEGAFTVQVGEKVVGTIAAAPSEAWQPHSLTLTATGTQALYLIYKGKGRAEMQALAFEEV